MEAATWYTLDRDLNTVEHHAVGVEAALRILRRYVSEVRPFYDTGEDALASTMFGFSRSDREFVEVCVHSHCEIAVKVEIPVPGLPPLLRSLLVYRHEETLSSIEDAAEWVRRFFMLPPDQLRTSLGDQPSWSGQV